MKKLGIFAFVVCLIVHVSTVDGQCNNTNDIINSLDQLDDIVAEYASLDSVLNRCLIGADNQIKIGLFHLNNFLDAKGEKRVVDYLTFLARIPVDIVAFADRYDGLKVGNGTLDSVDQWWQKYANSIPNTVFTLNNFYADKTGDTKKYEATLGNVRTRFSGLNSIDLEYRGIKPIGGSSSIVSDFRSFAPTADQFFKDFARFLLLNQPTSYRSKVGFGLLDRDLVFAYSWAATNYASKANVDRPSTPDNAIDTLALAPGLLQGLVSDYNSYISGKARPNENDLAYLYLQLSFRKIFPTATSIKNNFDNLGFGDRDLRSLSSSSFYLDNLFESLPSEYQAYLESSTPLGASKSDIDSLNGYLADIGLDLGVLLPSMRIYQPNGYNCIKGAFDSLDRVAFGIEILRKKYAIAGLDPINSAIDVIGNQLKAIKLIIIDYNQVHTSAQAPSDKNYFMINLLNNIIGSLFYELGSKKNLFQAPKYDALEQGLEDPGIKSIVIEYNKIKSGNGTSSTKSTLITSLETLMPDIERLILELIEIYTRMQDERDVPLLTTKAQNLLVSYNSVKSELGFPDQTLVRGVFSVIAQQLRGLFDECGNLQARLQQPTATDLKTIQYLQDTLKIFEDELNAINQAYPLAALPAPPTQNVSQGLRMLAATFNLNFNFDVITAVVQAINKQLTKIINIIEFVVNVLPPPVITTITRSNTIYSGIPVNQTQTKTEIISTELKTKKNTQLKTKTKWRTDNIHTTKTKERTRIKTKYVDNWLTHTIFEDRDVTHTHIIREPVTIFETVHKNLYDYDQKETLTHTIEIEKVITKTEKEGKWGREMIGGKMKTATKWLTKTIRDYLKNDQKENNKRKKYDSDSDDQDEIERRIKQVLKKKNYKL